MESPDFTADFSIDIAISFGHCDPAGIVFYPNYFRWFDRCFHSFLQARVGGHREMVAQLDAKGLGLMHSEADFPAPAFEGDTMQLAMRFDHWGGKSVRLAYQGTVGDRRVVTGLELRGLFQERDGRLRAGDMGKVRALFGL